MTGSGGLQRKVHRSLPPSTTIALTQTPRYRTSGSTVDRQLVAFREAPQVLRMSPSPGMEPRDFGCSSD
jgi:hypothetical protein